MARIGVVIMHWTMLGVPEANACDRHRVAQGTEAHSVLMMEGVAQKTLFCWGMVFGLVSESAPGK